jgi:hypothetical protein
MSEIGRTALASSGTDCSENIWAYHRAACNFTMDCMGNLVWHTPAVPTALRPQKSVRLPRKLHGELWETFHARRVRRLLLRRQQRRSGLKVPGLFHSFQTSLTDAYFLVPPLGLAARRVRERIGSVQPRITDDDRVGRITRVALNDTMRSQPNWHDVEFPFLASYGFEGFSRQGFAICACP